MDKREFARSIKEYLGLNDFKAVGVGAGSISFTRNNEEIGLGYLKFPGVYLFPAAFIGYKKFDEVENILGRYYRKHGIGLQNYTIFSTSRRFENITEIDIAKPTDIEKVLPQLRTMIYDDILPFFETYKTIEDVHKELTTYGNDFDKINRFLFTPQPIRRMIIKRLFSDSDWDEFAMNLTNSIVTRSKQEPNSQIAVYAQFLPTLYEELKEMHPLNL